MAANLFASLYSYRPGESLTPGENFLTEGFAYLLKSHEVVAKAWAQNVLSEADPVLCTTERVAYVKG